MSVGLPTPPARALYLAFACAALAVVPHAFWLPPVFAALAVGGIALRAVQLARGWRAWGAGLLALPTLAGLALVFWQFGSPVGRDAGTSLLLLMSGLKALECRQRRDAGVLILLALFLLAAAFFFQQSIGFALYALLVVALALVALMGLVATHAPPLKQRFRLALQMMASAAPLMLLLFYFFPRIDTPLGVLRDPGRVASTGLSDNMTPGQFGELVSSPEIAFRVRFQGKTPPASTLYWRGPVFWDYDGASWRTRLPPNGDEPLEVSGTPLAYTLLAPGNDRPWLLALEHPGDAPRGTRFLTGRQLSLVEPAREARQYELQAWRDVRLGADLSRSQWRRGLRLPADSAPRARELALRWRQAAGVAPEAGFLDAASAAAIVNQALAHFREAPYRYTLRPPALRGDPVDAFLFDTRAGFCEYYAGAFVVLMRAVGVPARVVTGYQGGEASPVADYFLVRQSDAHAWAEVWIDGRGWIRVDPTAAVAPERVERGLGNTLADASGLPAFLRSDARSGWLYQLRVWRDAADFQWTTWVLGFGQARQADLLKRLGLDGFGVAGLAVALGGGLLTILGAYGLVSAWRRWRHGSIAPEDAARARVLRALARAGVVPRTGEGPSDFIARAADTLPTHADALRRFNRAYVGFKFGVPGQTSAELAALEHAARAVAQAIRHRT